MGSSERFTEGMTPAYTQDVEAACRLYQGRNLPEIKTVALLGAGVLGSCVVTELAFSGVEINVYDRSEITRAEVSCRKSYS
jgi:phosphoglycerate dehydrogenase-like enzyme